MCNISSVILIDYSLEFFLLKQPFSSWFYVFQKTSILLFLTSLLALYSSPWIVLIVLLGVNWIIASVKRLYVSFYHIPPVLWLMPHFNANFAGTNLLPLHKEIFFFFPDFLNVFMFIQLYFSDRLSQIVLKPKGRVLW